MRRYYAKRNEKKDTYTDLAIERRRADTKTRGVEYTSSECPCGIWEKVRIYSDEGAREIGRPIGSYYTLNTGRMDLLSDDEIEEGSEQIAKRICEIVDGLDLIPDRILVVGLGNEALTPDSVGPKTADKVKPTLHIREFDDECFESLGCSEIAVIKPGVSAKSGVDSAEIIRGVSQRLKPDVIFAVDAILTSSSERLGSTVQISSTGLFAGSGVGNSRSAVNEESLGIPVISIGVPTVIDSRAFNDAEEVRRRLGDEAMLVAPKETDEITDAAAQMIGMAINQAFGISPY